MSTRRISVEAAGSLLEFGALVALLAEPLGGTLPAFLTVLAAMAVAAVFYLDFIRPRQVRWGATDEEVARLMPGDDIAGPAARCTTRAVTIQAPAGRVWQQVSPRDRVRLMPGPGFDLVQVEDGHYFVVRVPGQTMSWCLDLEQIDQYSCRLISRWHTKRLFMPASAPWIALSDPSSFITERRMLLATKARAEHPAEPT